MPQLLRTPGEVEAWESTYLAKLPSGCRSVGEFMSLDDVLSSVTGPLLASLSAFWLRLSEKASSLGRRTDVSWVGFAPNNPDVLRPVGLDPHPQLVVAPLPLPQQEAL